MHFKEIEKTVIEIMPKECEVVKVEPEGLSTVIYLKNIKAFYSHDELIKQLAGMLKKKVSVRVDASAVLDPEKTKQIIQQIVPKEAEIKSILFVPEFSEVHIEALKPGLVIGKGGSILKEIMLQTGWAPITMRTPTMPSVTLDGIRKSMVYEATDRKKFLLNIGKKICQASPGQSDWIRLVCLGGFREVGRSCVLVQTPHSKVLMDVGINAATGDPLRAYPYLGMMGFPIDQIDAVVVSHGHIDHMGFIPFLFKMGYEGPVYCTRPTRDIMVLLQQDYINLARRTFGIEPPYEKKHIQKELHHVITVDYGEVVDITPEMKMTFYNAGHILGSAIVHLHIGEGEHNLVYSLDYDTQVTVVDKDNKTHIVKIGELVDRQFNENIYENGFVERTRNFSGWKTFAFNPKTLKTELVDITSFIRHPITEDLYEITTRTGRKAVVTASHSVFIAKNGIVTAAKVKELNVGDYVIGPKELPVQEKRPEVILPGSIRTYENRKEEIEKRLNELLPKINELFKDEQKKELIISFVKDHLAGLYINQITKKYKVNEKRVKRAFRLLGIKTLPRAKDALPKRIEISENFARFLGYYVSEGCTTNTNTVIITNYTKGLLDDCIQIIENEFGIKGKIVKNDAQFYSKQLRLLLETLACGKGAYNKRVPKELFLARQDIILNFLKGYLDGDGSIRIRKKGVSLNGASKSEGLIQDLGLLFLRLGVPTTYEYNKTSEMHNIHVYGYELVSKLVNKLNIERWQEFSQHQKLKNKRSLATKIPINALSTGTQLVLSKSSYQDVRCADRRIIEENFECSEEDKLLIDSSFLFDEIKTIKKVNPTSKYVYDLQINGYENFIGGSGHLFLHNTGDLKFGFTKLFDPAHTNFPRVETLLIESTYGGKNDIGSNRMMAEQNLINMIKEATNRRGKVLIPVFAVGRSQELLLILEEYYRRNPDFNIPVYIDGMVLEASAIHTAYPEYMREQLQRRILGDNSPFESPMIKVAKGTDKETIANGEPAVILAPSGMLNGGPSYDYLQLLADDEKNALVFVGYQSALSLGSKLQRGQKELMITGDDGRAKTLNINMQIRTADGFSVPYDTDVMIKRKGQFEITEIGKIADEFIDDSDEGVATLDKIEVPAFDNEGKIKWHEASTIIKHKTKDKHLLIKTKSGKEIQVSKGHSLFVLKNNDIEIQKGHELRTGDHLIIPNKLPESHTIHSINFPEHLEYHEYKINENAHRFEPLNGGGGNNNYLNLECNDITSLAKFLGYYVAEGHMEHGERNTRAVLTFGSHEKELIEDAKNVIKKAFGLNTKEVSPHPSSVQLRANNKLLVRFLQNIEVGEGAKKKRVPGIVFNFDLETQKTFLKAYFDGDGYIYKHGGKGYLAAKSASKKLLSDISYLLLQHGIISRLKGPYTERERMLNGNLLKESTIWKIYIAEKDFEKIERKQSHPPFALPLNEIGLEKIRNKISGRVRWDLSALISAKKKGRNIYVGLPVLRRIVDALKGKELKKEQEKIITTIRKFTEGDLAADIITEIKEVNVGEFEYDFSVPEVENFVGGVGGVMLHNSGHASRDQLMAYLRNVRPTPERILTLHGDWGKTEELAQSASMMLRKEGRALNDLEAIRLR